MTDTINLTISTAALRAALLCASDERIRYYLRGVYVDPKGFIVSTDGHRLFCAKIDLTDAPAFDGWIICRDVLKRALTGNKAETIDVSPTRTGDVACQPIDGTYPDWRRVVPSDLSGDAAQFNPAYVADMGKIGDLLRGKRKGALSAHIHHNGEGPAGVTFPEIEDAFAVLMPIRSHHSDNGSAAWSNRRKLID